MASTTAKKFRIKENSSLLTINAPTDFKKEIGELPPGVIISDNTKHYQQIHWFVKDKAQVENEVNNVVALLKEEVVCWIYYPKGSSKMQTDLTRDKGWEALLRHKNLQWISLISFNATWSAFGMRLKTEADKKKEAQPKQRPIFDYIDAKMKTIRLPDDFAAVLNKSRDEKSFFETLSFTNKKEFVEWIVTAKREETRAVRVKESVERLRKGWKNPANR